eukprot:m.24362 g.24362  ORF g.24362 m.24362 type:complete len:285 (+) comp4000_c0_seq2:1-855(+)
MATTVVGNVLVLVVETNPHSWQTVQSPTFAQLVQHLVVFLNVHLANKRANSVCVIAAHTGSSRILYPTALESDEGRDTGKWQPLQRMNDAFAAELTALLSEACDLLPNTALGGALGKALCYINRVRQTCIRDKVPAPSGRVLVISAAPPPPTQYMAVMNAIFAAQKHSIPIDSCVLGGAPALLQQAAALTAGNYVDVGPASKVPIADGLIEVLLTCFLTDPEDRSTFTRPVMKQVDYQTSCTCHGTALNVGFVCSVCLTVYCKFQWECDNCKSSFKVRKQTGNA